MDKGSVDCYLYLISDGGLVPSFREGDVVGVWIPAFAGMTG